MKISRFNEDVSNLIDLEYITDCFIEFKTCFRDWL
jgi:hypothetical protein